MITNMVFEVYLRVYDAIIIVGIRDQNHGSCGDPYKIAWVSWVRASGCQLRAHSIWSPAEAGRKETADRRGAS